MFTVTNGSVEWTGEGQTIRVDVWGRDSLRVRAVAQGDIIDHNYALLPEARAVPSTDVAVETPEPGMVILGNGAIRAQLNKVCDFQESLGRSRWRCHVRIENAAGRVLVNEIGDGGALDVRARHFRQLSGGDYRVTASFETATPEHLVGMGEYQQHLPDLKGATLELAHRNSQASVPFVVSSAGYGFLWHNPGIGRVTFATNVTQWVAEQTDQLDYWVTAGDSPAKILEQYTAVTGRAPEFPEYGLGYWQCKLRYWNQEQLERVAGEFNEKKIPLDVIIADFFHWPHMGDYRFDPEFWPSPASMVQTLRDHGTELMVSVWPQVSFSSENYAKLSGSNFLVRSTAGSQELMAFQEPASLIDMTNPHARQFLWETCHQNYPGVRMFWLDEAEPEFGAYDYEAYRYHAGPALKVSNIYPQRYAQAFFEGATAAGITPLNLIRCAWAGSQRFGAVVWSGDIQSTWEALRNQIAIGIHLGMAGIPWFTTDIGGFHGGDVRDPNFVELLLRWFECATYFPVMRMHGDRRPFENVVGGDGTPRLRSGAANEPWAFGREAQRIMTWHIHLRQKLRPYLRRTFHEAHTTGLPVMRGLFLHYSDDERAWLTNDEFMLGRDVLVAPALAPRTHSRLVYLPGNENWVETNTERHYRGGDSIEVEIPPEGIPTFVRERGSITPTLWRHAPHGQKI
jgi:alpha-D-xyloside xylohydrolase